MATLVMFGHDISGPTGNRPTDVEIGQWFFDTTLGQILFWNGSSWVLPTGVAAVSSGPLAISPTMSQASGTSATLEAVQFAATTITVTGNTHVTTAAGFNFVEYEQPTYSAASAVTIDNAATVKIDNAPTGAGAGPATITNAYSLWVGAGTTRIDGALQVNAQSTSTPTMSVTSATSATLEAWSLKATTITVSGTTAITTAGGFNFAEIEQPTITDASACTITNAATLKIDNAPAAGGSAVITNAYALWVGAGATRFDGVVSATAANAAALAVGAAAHPAFNVDSSTGSSATGLNLKSAAAAGGFAVSVISSGAAENLTIDALGTGVVNVGGTSTGLVVLGRGAAKGVIQSLTKTATTAQNFTPSAAVLLGGYLAYTSQTGAGTVTLPTGTLLSGAVAGVSVGDKFECILANLGNQTLTVTGATGSTISAATPFVAIPTLRSCKLVFVNTGANTWDVLVLVGAAA